MSATSSTSSASSLALSGLASGIDWTSIVNELLTVERAPETQMTTEETTNSAKKAAYQSIGTQLTTLQNDITTLSDPTFFDSRNTALSNSSVATATAATGAPLGTYNFNIVQTATNAVQQGAVSSGKPLNSTDDVSNVVLSSSGFSTTVTPGTFSVNGQAVTIATSDTLQSVFDKISAATSGAVTASYDSTTDEISLASSSAVVLGSATDTSNFLQAAELYNNGTGNVTSASTLGGVNLSNTMANANLATTITDGGSGAGSFSINGVAISFDASTDSVNDVLQRINDSSAGVTATYDSVNDRFQLTNKTTGDVGISLQDNTGNFLAATGLSSGTLSRGDNLRYQINNGGIMTSQSNTVSGTASGVNGLSLTAEATGTTTVTISSDTSKISSAVSSFITDYNAVQNGIATQITPTTSSSGTVTPGTLTGDLGIEDIADTLRQMVGAIPSGLTGTVQSLNDLGITSNGNDNTLSLSDSTALASALSSNLAGVKSLFSNATNGIATALGTYVTNTTSSSGVLVSDENNMDTENTGIASSITALEARISQDQTRLTNEFVAMETAINSFNSEKQYLSAYFDSSTATTTAPTAASSSSTSSSSS